MLYYAIINPRRAKAMKNKSNCNKVDSSYFTNKNVNQFTSAYENKTYYKDKQNKDKEEFKRDAKIFSEGFVKSAVISKISGQKVIPTALKRGTTSVIINWALENDLKPEIKLKDL
jgi:hypothetical protein